MEAASEVRAGLAQRLRERAPLAAAVAILLAYGACVDFIAEDAYVSFRCAARLLDYGELSFNAGERVEAYTNLLWTLLLAAAAQLGASFEGAARFAGTSCGLTSLGIVWLWSRELGNPRAGYAALLLALEPCHALWSHLGLEVSLLGCLWCAAFWLASRPPGPGNSVRLSALVAAAYLTRPEGMLALPALFGLRSHQLRGRQRLQTLAALSALPLATLIAHVGWRRAYYGDWLPNTFYVKATVSWASLSAGSGYAVDYLGSSAWLALPLMAAYASRHALRLPPALLAAALLCVALLGYVVCIGGDYMAASRFLAPLSPLLAVLSAQLMLQIRRAAPLRMRHAWLGLLILGALLAGRRTFSELTTREDGFITRLGAMRAYVENWQVIGSWMHPHVPPDFTITSSAIGIAAWSVYPARVIDARGLADRWVARHGERQTFRPGHEVFAPDSYLLAKHPELLMHRYVLAKTEDLQRATERVRAPGYHPSCVRLPLRDASWFCFGQRDDVSFAGIGRRPAGRERPAALFDPATQKLEWIEVSRPGSESRAPRAVGSRPRTR
ncbi:MAG TPA: hypothetical protein VJR89_02950 [Polyangiales bacterium]|nr:hypothetical protein [Polyangiales bacterium]